MNYSDQLLRHIPGLTLILVVSLLFCPFVEVITLPNQNGAENFFLAGLGVYGNSIDWKGLHFLMDVQLFLLCSLCLCSFFVLLSKGRVRFYLLSLSAFILIMLPVWMMAFLEGFFRFHLGAEMQYNYSIAWLILPLALLGVVISILGMNKEEYSNKKVNSALLDY